MNRPVHENRRERVRRVRGLLELLLRRFALAGRADVACCGMTVAQAATLNTLSTEGAMRLGTLSVRLGISPSTLSRNVDRLEERGLVRRSPDPADRRAIQVALSDGGYEAAAQLKSQEDEFMEAVLACMSDDDAMAVVHGLEALLRAVRELTESCCPGAYEHLVEKVESDPKGCCYGKEDC